ncbi:MAG: asparagine synthase (glutamine-hydrolyzing), partial [Planctomycetota bacterium]
MCGFAGVVSFGPGEERAFADATLTRDLLDGLAHRGPDGEGTWRCDHEADQPAALLVHRRLAVLDPRPRSGQPFTSADGRLALVYNGELFNFRDLRNELSRDWQTDGDTEVLLAAYEQWGEACVDRFDGMFAFAILDRREPGGRLVLARDPVGEKPLYLTRMNGGSVAFASELRPLRRAVRRLGFGGLGLDVDALRDYLAWGYVPDGRTIHAGIESLLPGTCVTITPEGRSARRYFHAGGRFEEASPDRFESGVTRTRTLVAKAVEKRLVSDVPVGCLLSGGIDSSVVALHMARALGKGVPTFSMGFRDATYDERPFAEEVAQSLGCDHHAFELSAEGLASDDLPRLVRSVGQPFADSSLLPTRLLCEQVRRHVTVALGGDGGDEAFGGYDRYRALLLLRHLAETPGGRSLASLMSMSKPVTRRLSEKHPLRRLTRLVAAANKPPAQQYAEFLRVYQEEQIRWIAGRSSRSLAPQVLLRTDSTQIAGLWFDAFLRPEAEPYDLAATAAALDRSTYLPGDLLVKVDRASMLHGLEVRSPMVDADLVQFCSTLGDDHLTGLRRGKRLLRDAFAKQLPASVFGRRKMGFAVPISSWL